MPPGVPGSARPLIAALIFARDSAVWTMPREGLPGSTETLKTSPSAEATAIQRVSASISAPGRDFFQDRDGEACLAVGVPEQLQALVVMRAAAKVALCLFHRSRMFSDEPTYARPAGPLIR